MRVLMTVVAAMFLLGPSLARAGEEVPIVKHPRPTERYYCAAYNTYFPENRAHTTYSEDYYFAYRNVWQECRHFYPQYTMGCQVDCQRIR